MVKITSYNNLWKYVACLVTSMWAAIQSRREID